MAEKNKILSEADIKPYARNAKKHPEKQLLALANIVREVGWRQPGLVNLEGTLIAGHGRWMAYLQFKETHKLPTIWVIDTKGRTVCGEADKRPRGPSNYQTSGADFESINEFFPPGGVVLDLFMGSGSTMIASEKAGRISYGMELEPIYIDVAVQRYVNYTGISEITKNGKIITWEPLQSENE